MWECLVVRVQYMCVLINGLLAGPVGWAQQLSVWPLTFPMPSIVLAEAFLSGSVSQWGGGPRSDTVWLEVSVWGRVVDLFHPRSVWSWWSNVIGVIVCLQAVLYYWHALGLSFWRMGVNRMWVCSFPLNALQRTWWYLLPHGCLSRSHLVSLAS